jgi:folate-binding protein YgfZ
MFTLNTLSVIEFSDHDAGQFLHNQLSADIRKLAPGDAGFACCCNPAGRVLELLLVCPRTDSILVICRSSLAAALVTRLTKFIFRAKVKIEIREDLVVAAVDASSTQSETVEVYGLKYAIVTAGSIKGTENLIDNQAWKVNELKKGIVWLDEVSSATFLPQMLGFENIGALSFQKGCYPGQEIIARTRYLGKLKRRPLLVRVSDSTPLINGTKVTLMQGEESNTAVVVDSAIGPDNDQYLYLVARMNEGFCPDQLMVDDKSLPVIKP